MKKSKLNLIPVLTANKAFILGYSSDANNVYEMPDNNNNNL